MKYLALGLCLIVVSAGLSIAVKGHAHPQTKLAELPPPPAWLPQQQSLASVFQADVFRIDAQALICAAARKHRVSAAFITSIMAAESNFDPSATSPKGAIGLMQLMPATAQLFGADPAVPEQNVDAGAHYLRVLMDRYHGHRNWLTRVIAAYNAGPAAVDRYHGVPPYCETKTYVARVLAFMIKFGRQRA
jgi:soluble lytic murein transglycosylase-like protein